MVNNKKYFIFRNNKETVTNPGFSYRITQRVHEMRSTMPNTDVLNMKPALE